MEEQNRTGVANYVKDVARLLEPWMVGRPVRRIVQSGDLERGKLHQIAHREDAAVGLEDVGPLVESEFGCEHPAVHRVHSLHHFEPHDRRETPVAQFSLDEREKVVGVFFVALGVGVARNAEKLARGYVDSREQEVEVVRDDVFERDEPVALANSDKSLNPRSNGHLDPRQRRVAVAGSPDRDQQVQRKVRDKGKWMRGIDRERRDQREDVGEIGFTQSGLLLDTQVLMRNQPDTVCLREGEKPGQNFALALLLHADLSIAFGDLPRWRAPVDRKLLNAGSGLLLQAADPFHEELVKIGGGNREKFEPLEQRVTLVLRFGENPAVECEPGQLAVEVELGRRQGIVNFRRRNASAYQARGRSAITIYAVVGFVNVMRVRALQLRLFGWQHSRRF